MVRSRKVRRLSTRLTPPAPPDDDTVFVGMRVSELPVPHVPSITGQCHRCHEAIWVSKRDAGMAFRIGRTVCVECMLELIEPQSKKTR